MYYTFQAQDWGTTSSLTRSDSTGSQQSVQSYASPAIPPYGSSMKGGSVAEILIGLAYNGTTGRLSVEIIKGSHFRGGGGNDTKPPDTYVKLALIDSNNHEMGRSKTGLKRAQPNPLYKETFIFQVTLLSFLNPLAATHLEWKSWPCNLILENLYIRWFKTIFLFLKCSLNVLSCIFPFFQDVHAFDKRWLILLILNTFVKSYCFIFTYYWQWKHYWIDEFFGKNPRMVVFPY